MKINIAAPSTGMQKVIEIDDEKRLQNLYERKMAQEISGDVLGDEFAGYILRISGGNDKQGFPMRQGILTNTRVRILVRDRRITVPALPVRGRGRVSVGASLDRILLY